ncbi:hypothetical protein FGIG_02004 [Fasciola gigantica]|uniref:Uncharacterized protein n=1 Tax=Fasciola gigantica TaxID=46835 RepID=A0A504YFS9_FASGI|nr:hypothetical protein FGIG_02004 [Fasciola gigantica]
MDTEFGILIKEIKPLYKSLRDFNEKRVVGHLIKELIQLSTNETQKIQRNELARALLLKLKSNQNPYFSRWDFTQLKVPLMHTEVDVSHSVPSLNEESCKMEELSGQAKTKKPRRIRFHSKSSNPNKCVVKICRPNYRRLPNRKQQAIRNPKRHQSSSVQSFVTDSADSCGGKCNYSSTPTNTESETSAPSDHVSVHDRITRAHRAKGPHLLQMHRSNIYSESNFAKHLDFDEKKEYIQQNSNSKNSALIKPAISRAQISETNFYDHLLEIRRESEIEIAKLMSRKNAELATVQRDAERKHAELKTAVDKLEEQLAMAVANADNVRRQSEDQSNQLQMIMTKQLDSLFEQSAQQKEELVREHQEKIEELKKAHRIDLEQLKVEQKRTEELELCVQQERLRSAELQTKLKDYQSQLDKACERQLYLQSSIDNLTETLKNKELNFQAQIDSQKAEVTTKHMKEIAELKCEHDSKMDRLTKEHEKSLQVLEETIQCLRDELKNSQEDAEKQKAKLVFNELSAAYDQGREYAIRDCQTKIDMLQQRLADAQERQQLAKDNFRLRMTQAKEELSRIQTAMSEKEAELNAGQSRLNQMVKQLESKFNIPLTCSGTQTDEFQCTCVALRVGEVVAKEMAFWQQKSLDKTIENAKNEEGIRLEALFHEKEEHIYRQHKLEMEAIRNEHSNQISSWRNRVELARKQINQLEVELSKAKGLLAKEIETRRQQISEISQAREFERREWKRQQDENLKCIAREQEEQIKQMRAQYVDDVETTTNQKLNEIEAEYKNQVMELSQDLQESRAQIDKLKDALQKTLYDQEKMKHNMESEYRLKMDGLRKTHEEEILSIKDGASKDRARARTAEALLRQHEKLWNTQVKQKAMHLKEDLLPADIRGHLESTIDSLRLQVDLLQKRIALLETDKVTNNSVWQPFGHSTLRKSDTQRLEKFAITSAEHEIPPSVDVVHPTGDKPTPFGYEIRNQNNENNTILQNQAQPFVENISPDHQKSDSSMSETIRKTLVRIANGKIEA